MKNKDGVTPRTYHDATGTHIYFVQRDQVKWYEWVSIIIAMTLILGLFWVPDLSDALVEWWRS